MAARRLLSEGACSVRREAQDVAAPSLVLAAGVLAFLGIAFSGIEDGHAAIVPDERLPVPVRCPNTV